MALRAEKLEVRPAGDYTFIIKSVKLGTRPQFGNKYVKEKCYIFDLEIEDDQLLPLKTGTRYGSEDATLTKFLNGVLNVSELSDDEMDQLDLEKLVGIKGTAHMIVNQSGKNEIVSFSQPDEKQVKNLANFFTLDDSTTE